MTILTKEQRITMYARLEKENLSEAVMLDIEALLETINDQDEMFIALQKQLQTEMGRLQDANRSIATSISKLNREEVRIQKRY